MAQSEGSTFKQKPFTMSKYEKAAEHLEYYANGYYQGNNIMQENFREAAALLRQRGWISVESQMPEHNVGVLVFIPEEDYHITSGMWDISNKWVLLDEYRKPECKVTHWMPLVDIPEEYRKQRDVGYKIMGWMSKALKGKQPPSSK
jgi:hypothetical protein